LKELELLNLVEALSQKQARGRPQLYYRLTKNAQSLFPTLDGKLLYELIGFLGKSKKQNILLEFFRGFWKQRLSNFEKLLTDEDKKDLNCRIQALGQLLKSEGFMPKIEKTNDHKVVVRECNCPFPQAVRATKIPCRLEAEFMALALGRPVVRTSYIPEGDSSCSYEVQS
jgi:predicted ArsR family transcriptional regulator